MNFGVKSYDKEEFFDYFIDKADFFEIQAIRENDYSFLKKYVKKSIPIIIHAEHHSFGVNHCDPKKEEINLESIRFAQKVANEANAKFIIVHPGRIADNDCSIDYFIKTFKKINDPRIIIENLPQCKRVNYITKASTPAEIKFIMDQLNCGFCFDLNHASETLENNRENLFNLFNEFMSLKPVHFHLCGEKDKGHISHINLRDSELDINLVKQLLPKNANITLEVSIDKNEVEKDLEFAKANL